MLVKRQKALKFNLRRALFAGAAVLGLSSFSLGHHASAQDIEFSMPTVILFALENNPDVGVARERANQANYSIDEVTADLYPQVETVFTVSQDTNDPSTGSELSAGESDTTGTSTFSLTVTQLLFDGFGIQNTIKNREQLYTSAEIQSQIAAQKVVQETIAAYLDLYRAQQVYRNTVKFMRRIREINEKIEIMAEVGAASQAKLGFAKARLAFAKTEMQNISAEVNDAISTLEALTGELPDFAAQTPDELDPSVLDLEFYLDMALKQNAEMRLNTSNRQALVYQLKTEEADMFPTVTADFSFSQRNDDGGETGMERDIRARLEVAYNIFDGFKGQAKEKRIKSQLAETDHRRRKVVDVVQREIKQRYNQITSIESNIDVTREEIENNIEVQRLNYENFELGNIDIIELIEGEERLNSSRSRLHSQIADLYRNTFELLQYVGALEKEAFCGSC